MSNLSLLIKARTTEKFFETLCRATELEPYFQHNGKRIHVLYDPPHLLKNIRNNLRKAGFAVGSQQVKWEHIKSFYNFDKQNRVRLAPKLTLKHINLPPFSELRVKFATQILSHSVAAGMSTLIQLGVLPTEAEATAVFLDRFDKLFNAFNSGSRSSSQPMRHAVMENSSHHKFLDEMLEWIKSIKTLGNRSLPCIKGWKMSIRSLQSLWKDLRKNHNVQYLLTNRLNQDCVENLFSILRGKGGHGDNPTPQQFRHFLRQVMVDSIQVLSQSSNCAEDIDTFLLSLSEVSGQQTSATTVEQQLTVQPFPVAETDGNTELLWLISNPGEPQRDPAYQEAEKNVLTYISGYIVRKLRNKVCAECSKLLIGELSGEQNELFLINKQHEDTVDGLVIPSSQLVDMILDLERNYNTYIERYIHMDKVKARLADLMSKELGNNVLVCPMQVKRCPLQKVIIHLFMNIRLHFTLKESCRSFNEQSGVRKNRKILKLSHQ